MTPYEEQLNLFFVKVFNDILRLEEESMTKVEHKNLSLSEIHVIEAVCDSEGFEQNTMKELSKQLRITASSLTIAVKTLEQKGYLIRNKSDSDKRKVMVCSTPLARRVNEDHKAFHRKLIESVSHTLKDDELAALTTALETMHRFFTKIKL